MENEKSGLNLAQLNKNDFIINNNKIIESPLKYGFQKITLVENFNDVIKYNKNFNNLFKRVIEDVVKFDTNGNLKCNFNSQNLTAIKILLNSLTVFNYEDDFNDVSNSKLRLDCKKIFEGIFSNKFKAVKKEFNGVVVEKFIRNSTTTLKVFINNLIKTLICDNEKVIVKYTLNNKEYFKLMSENIFNSLSIQNVLEAQNNFIKKIDEVKEENYGK